MRNKVYLKNVFCGAFLKLMMILLWRSGIAWTTLVECLEGPVLGSQFEVATWLSVLGEDSLTLKVLRGEAKLQTSSLQTAAQHLLLPQRSR